MNNFLFPQIPENIPMGGGGGFWKTYTSGSQGVKLQCSILVYLESFRIF